MTQWQPDYIENKEQDVSQPQYLSLENGYLNFTDAKVLKFGVGNYSLGIDNRYGLWAGSSIYSQAPFRVSSSGTTYVRTILLENTTLPTYASVGELAVAGGSLYICKSVAPVVWQDIGAH